ncbi:vegetative incompatibility protein HET-E-1-like, partial [Trifolium medium]|nr:vegetative incompatibility protein HET-E-1-like [Trifolium medium]
GVTCLAWLGASYVATGCLDGNIRVWDSRSAECVRNFTGHSDAISSVEVSANREYLVSNSLDSAACVFDVKWLQ